MAIDNLGLKTIVNEVNDELNSAFLEKPIALSDSQFAFSYHRGKNSINKGRGFFIISLDPSNPFICYSFENFSKVNISTPFVVSLKKLTGCLVESIEKVEGERIVIVNLKSSDNDVLNLNTGYQIIIELFPQRPNMYVIPLPSNKVSSIYKENLDVLNDSCTARGLPYIFPSQRLPLSENLNSLEEVKPFLARSTYNNFEKYINQTDFSKGLRNLINSNTLYTITNKIEPFHFDNPFAKKIDVNNIYSFYVKDQKSLAKKANESDLLTKIKKLLNVTVKKKLNLEKDLDKAKKHQVYMQYGQELFLHQTEYVKGMDFMDVDGFHIPLDSKIGIISNANKYFKQYHKSKSALTIIGPLIEKTEDEITYLQGKLLQIDKGSFNDIKEMKMELELEGYIKTNRKREITKKGTIKKSNPHYLKSPTYKIGFGMNALQNESLTFDIAPRSSTFLHVANYPGSHVVIIEGDNNETRLLAAELALYLSKLDSGDVQVAPIKMVKKNKSKLGLVNLLEYKLISIKKIREASIELFENM
jgi:predicted ribosome quality control (RQC) complex YloA/Tae2 family protein